MSSLNGEEKDARNYGENSRLLESSPEPSSGGGRGLNKVMVKKTLRGVGAGVCIALVVGSWAIMAEELQNLGKTFKQPFFQTYWIQSSYAILYVVWKIWLRLFLTSGFLAAVGFASGVLWYVSLELTTVSANTAIYQSTSAVVFIMSIPLLKERVTVVKILSVALTVMGVCLVSLFSSSDHGNNDNTNSTSLSLTDEQEPRSTPIGYVCVLFSTILYAGYETIYKKFGTHSDDSAPVWNGVRVIGYVGVHTLAFTWPVIIIVHFMGVEKFRFPSLEEFPMLLGMTILDIVFNGALLLCITLSTPLVASVGSVLTLPMTVFLDWILKHEVMTWQSFIGVGGIVVGFFLLIFSEYWQMRLRVAESSNINAMYGSLNKSQRVGINSSHSRQRLQTMLKRYII